MFCAMFCATLWHIVAQIYISKVCHVFCHVLYQTAVIGVNGVIWVKGVNGVKVSGYPQRITLRQTFTWRFQPKLSPPSVSNLKFAVAWVTGVIFLGSEVP